MFWCFSFCFKVLKFNHKINILKGTLYQNNYSCDFVHKYIEEILDRALMPETVVSTVPKKNLMIMLAYFGTVLLHIHIRINLIMKNKLHHCNLQVVSRLTEDKKFTKISEDKIDVLQRSDIVYKFKCWWLWCLVLKSEWAISSKFLF